ncbi:hypothetical protein [Qipengyuania zhejiangensis]|uniref:hypothetical protein n=1 Tax=Qipengyuania zhejiangensis TaxID=3077782 RepID=UPI002D7811B9|nr:hypothetical protein [Qipengyuania sp. Z2]
MPQCPKCRARMAQGFVFLPDTGGRVKWMDGEPGFWKSMLGIGAKTSDMVSRRCEGCGYVEFYVESKVAPVRTLRAVDEENERLRNLVTKLQERVGTLEEIATDPAVRTAREIESLRSRPAAEND